MLSALPYKKSSFHYVQLVFFTGETKPPDTKAFREHVHMFNYVQLWKELSCRPQLINLQLQHH